MCLYVQCRMGEGVPAITQWAKSATSKSAVMVMIGFQPHSKGVKESIELAGLL